MEKPGSDFWNLYVIYNIRVMSNALRLVAFLVLGTVPLGAQHAHDRPTGPAPLFDNLGRHHHPVTTRSALAQRYFDQGLRLFYAFNLDESLRSFQQAARIDPNCAMAYWGMALALGPNINIPMTAEQEREAREAVQKALALSSRATERERDYIGTLSRRYSAAPEGDRLIRQRAYADAMRDLMRRYPEDPDAAVLFADALMNLRPWDLWTLDGQPQPETLELIAVLEKVLETDPDHPGANHYYIHALEASPYPERALGAAERIAGLVPGAGHLVHMPSHIYFRLGRYQDAVESSRRGAAVDKEYILRWNPRGNYPLMFYSHNIYFEWAALCMEGRSREAIRAARALVANFPDEAVRRMPMLEFFRPVPLFTLARFGRWEEILQEPPPSPNLSYLVGMWHYARGLALSALDRREEAQVERERLAALAAAAAERVPLEGNSPSVLLRLALTVLEGEMAARRGDLREAVGRLSEAVRSQDRLRYDEPPPWYYSVRQSLGAVLLEAGQAAQAEVVYREDLRRYPENGWSLYGLLRSLQAQERHEEARSVEDRFRRAWARADVTPAASRF